MPRPIRVTSRIEIPEAELSWRFSRSGGPGGQSVNTADTRAELSFDIAASAVLPGYLKDRLLRRLRARVRGTVVTVVAAEHRSQLKNREAAERRLSALLAEAAAPPPPARRPTKPTAAAKRARVDDKRHRSAVKRMRRSTDD